MACKCVERLIPVAARDWMVTAYRVTSGRRIRASRASTVECIQCRAIWRSCAGYVEALT
jgi:hypothetical protein